MGKGGFVLRMVFLLMCIGFWVLTLNSEINNDNINCLFPHVQETVGCWSRAEAATISVSDRKRVSAELPKLSILMANSSHASTMQGRKRISEKGQLKRRRAIPGSAEASSATVRKKYVAVRIYKLLDKIRKRRGDLINSPTYPALLNRKV